MPAPRKPVEPPIVSSQPKVVSARPRKGLRIPVSVVMVLGGLIALMIIARAAQPLLVMHSEKSEISQLIRQRDAERARNQELKARQKWLMSAEGLQAEARKYGYVKKGEIPVQLVEPRRRSVLPN